MLSVGQEKVDRDNIFVEKMKWFLYQTALCNFSLRFYGVCPDLTIALNHT
jgi:hypothetical protein